MSRHVSVATLTFVSSVTFFFKWGVYSPKAKWIRNMWVFICEYHLLLEFVVGYPFLIHDSFLDYDPKTTSGKKGDFRPGWVGVRFLKTLLVFKSGTLLRSLSLISLVHQFF
jgi:hypothetical protein